MNAFLVFAIVALVLGGLAAWKALDERRKYQGYMASEPTTSAELQQLAQTAQQATGGPGSFSQFVDLEGTADAGPNGLVESPISKTPCVWHAHKVTREYEQIRRDSEGDERREKHSEVVDEGRSNEWFHLKDEHGQVAVAPSRTWVDGARKSVSDYKPAEGGRTDVKLGSLSLSLPSMGGGTLGYTYEEWVVLPGTHLYVQGEAEDKRGYITVRNPEGRRDLVISTRSEDELRGESKKSFMLYAGGAIAAGVVCLICLVIGLVKLVS